MDKKDTIKKKQNEGDYCIGTEDKVQEDSNTVTTKNIKTDIDKSKEGEKYEENKEVEDKEEKGDMTNTVNPQIKDLQVKITNLKWNIARPPTKKTGTF